MLHEIRGFDLAGRLGGDEFIVLMRGDEMTQDQYPYMAQRIVDTVKRPMTFLERDVTVSVSIGIAKIPTDGKTSQEAMRHADRAMYRAKASGKNRFCLYDSMDDDEASEGMG